MRWLSLSLASFALACSSSNSSAVGADAGGGGGGFGGSGAIPGSGGAVQSTGGRIGSGGAAPSTGGRMGSGGAAPSTGGRMGSAGDATGGHVGTGGSGGAPHQIQACPSVNGGSNVGVWENITPPGIGFPKWCTPQWNTTCPGPGETSASGVLATYGTNAVAIDPTNTATVYLGTSSLGLFKTTDCGATWVHISTGTNGTEIDKGRNWSLVVDPMDSQIVYTTAGYSMGDVFKSTNGGIDWKPMLTPTVRTALAGGFVEKITLDPTNHLHLLVSAHGGCTNTTSSGCLAESTDGGSTWSLTNSAESWTEGDGQTMVNAKTWFFGSLFGGIWRTTNAGAAWTQVYHGNAAGDVFIASDGSFYACSGTILHSADGVSWSSVPNGKRCGGNSNGGAMIAGDGQTMYTSDGNGLGWGQTQPPADGWYWSTSEKNPTTWTSLKSPASMTQGGISIAYDPDHHILYSSNYVAGFFRVIVP